MAHNCTLGKLYEDVAAGDHANVDEAEGLGDAPLVVVKRQILVLSFQLLGHLVFDPLECDTLLVDGLEEDLVLAHHLEVKLDRFTSNCILELLFSRLAVCVGQTRHVYHIYTTFFS